MDDIFAQLEATAAAIETGQPNPNHVGSMQPTEVAPPDQPTTQYDYTQQEYQQAAAQDGTHGFDGNNLADQGAGVGHGHQQQEFMQAPPQPENQEQGQQQEGQPQKKRRSKWSDNGQQPEQGDQPGSLPPPPSTQRRHRWGPPMGSTEEPERGRRKKRSRWEEPEQPSQAIVVAAPLGLSISQFTFPKEVKLSSGIVVSLPQSLTGDSADPKIRALHQQLREIDRKLETGEFDIPPEGQRSPSPTPVYDKNGVRLNTREIRMREKLQDQKQRVIEELIKEDPNYKPPADYRPRKFTARVRIPQDEYPSYNFIGLLIGPRGNTQKRMQQETNTKIAIRGRGSVKEGANKDPKYDYGEDEELHVLVTGNTQHDVDRAVAMIELLCRPDDDSLSEHKRLQLRELAALNGTLKDDVACPICGEFTHRGYECPNQKQELYVLPEAIKQKVEEQYQRDVARVRGADAVASEDDYKTFLKELGGAPPPELMGEIGMSSARRAGLGAGSKGRDLPDDCKLYVGSLPATFTDSQLVQLFEQFGNVNHASVVLDQVTGQSRSYGFVHFDDPVTTRTACDSMNGKMVDGRPLVVRVRSDPMERGPRPISGPLVHDNVNTLYVTALAPSVTEDDLRRIFGEYGTVTECRLIMDRNTGMSKGFAFVTMSSESEMMAGLHGAQGYQVDGRAMVVKKATSKDERAREERPFFRPRDGPHRDGHDYPPRDRMPPHPSALPPHPGGGHGHDRDWDRGHPMGGPPPPHWSGPPRGPPPGAHYPPPYGAPPGPYGMPPPHYPPYGAPPPYGMPPAAYPGYGMPPPGYGAPYGAPPPAYPGYGHPAYPSAAAQPPLPPSGAAAAPSHSAQPPLPSEPAPPVPSSAPQQQSTQSDYEKFMLEMQKTFQ